MFREYIPCCDINYAFTTRFRYNLGFSMIMYKTSAKSEQIYPLKSKTMLKPNTQSPKGRRLEEKIFFKNRLETSKKKIEIKKLIRGFPQFPQLGLGEIGGRTFRNILFLKQIMFGLLPSQIYT